MIELGQNEKEYIKNELKSFLESDDIEVVVSTILRDSIRAGLAKDRAIDFESVGAFLQDVGVPLNDVTADVFRKYGSLSYLLMPKSMIKAFVVKVQAEKDIRIIYNSPKETRSRTFKNSGMVLIDNYWCYPKDVVLTVDDGYVLEFDGKPVTRQFRTADDTQYDRVSPLRMIDIDWSTYDPKPLF